MRSDVRVLVDGLRGARVFDLAQPLESSIPPVPSVPPFLMAWVMRHGDFVLPGGTSFVQELVSMGTHTGTHIDALNHVSCDGRLHRGADATAAPRSEDHEALAVQAASFVHHGVLLDIPAARGVDRLASGEAVTAEDIERACTAQGVEVPTEAAVLVRTGWGEREHYRSGQYLARPPGVDLSGAQRLVRWGVRLTGSDTFMYEQPAAEPFGPLPVHGALIVDAGVHIVENLFLEELAQAKVYEFALIVAPLSMTGASGSPIRPLAFAL